MKKELKVTPGIFPMPVLMIGTYNEDGSVDVMNAAWGMAQSMNELKLCLTESHKTVQNMKRTGYCTVALGTKDLVVESDYLGMVSGNNVPDKFEKSGLHATKSKKVDAPIIEEYPICMECKVVSFEEDGTLVQVVNVLADEKYLNDDGTIRLDEVGIISYDPYGHGYYVVGNKVGQAFSDGKQLMK
ncbi:MAG: flavin reductase family protein [Clostridia bacterium]|nr:flavin reductase family protein [Clostridia bacterium]